jgi:hypothetical protein
MMQVASCGYFTWHDPEITERARFLLRELRCENIDLMRQNKALRRTQRGVDIDNDGAEELKLLKSEMKLMTNKLKKSRHEVLEMRRWMKIYKFGCICALAICLYLVLY